MVIEKLRESTAQIHKELDTWLMPVFRQVNDTGKYEQLLKAFYEYYAPVMEMISGEIDTRYLPDFTQRRKPALILNDLDSINKQNAFPMQVPAKLPVITNASEAFGALYVLEGSTLGGVFLSRMLAENMKIDEKNGLSFFYGYGKESREKWNVFIEQINLFAAEKGDEALIVNTAGDTFKYFKKHLQQRLQYN
jgi:heme oxygenase (biliverdin-IX-beta and delta-forming)